MIDIQIIPEASASVVTLMKSVNRVIINPIIFFLFAVAMVYFLYGLAQYLLSPDNEEVRKTSKSHMIWGVVGLFVMVAVFGIMKLILNTVGENKIKIQNNGDYTVDNSAVNSKNRVEYQLDQGSLNDPTKTNSTVIKDPTKEIDPTSSESDVSAANYSTNPKGDYETSPFKQYVASPKCWRKPFFVTDVSEYKALKSIGGIVRGQMLIETGLTDAQVDKSLPFAFETKTLYDSKQKLYYLWWDARAPINGGTRADCNLAVESLPPYGPRSAKANFFVGAQYDSDAIYYRAIDSGVAPTENDAKVTALMNAAIQLSRMKGLTNTKFVEANATRIDLKCYPLDSTTKMYDCWTVLQIKIK